MKKHKLLVLGAILTSLLSLSACGPKEQKPKEQTNMIIRFYLDYSHSESAYYTMRWYREKPLGECPKEAALTNADAPDPLYPIFLGYSEYPSAIDETLLWDFSTDYKTTNLLLLYGIWVSE